jgi:hypothetical protein
MDQGMIRTVLQNRLTAREDRLDEDRLAFPAPADMDGSHAAEITWSSGGGEASYRAKDGSTKRASLAKPKHLSLQDDGARVLLSAYYRAPDGGKESCPLCEIVRHE